MHDTSLTTWGFYRIVEWANGFTQLCNNFRKELFYKALGEKKLNHLIAETCDRFPENKYEIEKHIAFKSNIIAAFYNN